MNAYGFKVSDMKGALQVMELAKELTELYGAFKNYLNDRNLTETEENFEEWIRGYFQMGTHHGLGAFITALINEKEGLELCCDDDYEIIYFPAIIPWESNERMRTITKEEMDEIFHKWIGKLTDEKVEIRYFEFS